MRRCTKRQSAIRASSARRSSYVRSTNSTELVPAGDSCQSTPPDHSFPLQNSSVQSQLPSHNCRGLRAPPISHCRSGIETAAAAGKCAEARIRRVLHGNVARWHRPDAGTQQRSLEPHRRLQQPPSPRRRVQLLQKVVPAQP